MRPDRQSGCGRGKRDVVCSFFVNTFFRVVFGLWIVPMRRVVKRKCPHSVGLMHDSFDEKSPALPQPLIKIFLIGYSEAPHSVLSRYRRKPEG